jgi:hypothetical protein
LTASLLINGRDIIHSLPSDSKLRNRKETDMNPSIAFAAALLCLVLSLCVKADESRVWTDSTGKHKTEAAFVSLEDDVVTLRQPGTGKELKIPLERLSDADQEYVDDLLRKREQQEAKDSPTRQPQVVTPPEVPTVGRPGTTSAGRRPPNNVINSVRGAAYRTEASNNMRQITLGILAYESTHGRFPAAAHRTADGKPGLSWRVAILPMIEMNGLYRQFKLDEPWDSDHNKALISQMPSIYKSPGSDLDDGYTNYLAVVSPDTIISNGRRPTRSTDVRDGLSRTVMIVEADDNYAAIWTQPADYDWDANDPAYGLGGIWSGTFFVGFGDGRIDRLDATVGAETLNAYFSRNGGEVVP